MRCCCFQGIVDLRRKRLMEGVRSEKPDFIDLYREEVKTKSSVAAERDFVPGFNCAPALFLYFGTRLKIIFILNIQCRRGSFDHREGHSLCRHGRTRQVAPLNMQSFTLCCVRKLRQNCSRRRMTSSGGTKDLISTTRTGNSFTK